MHVIMVDILLQVLTDTLRETRGKYAQSRPNIRGNRPERSRLQNPTHLSSRTNTSRFSWPRRIKASTSFVAQLRAETQNNMGSIMHTSQSREDDLQSHRSQSNNRSWEEINYGWIGWMGTSDTWNKMALRFKSCVKHGISNSLLHHILWSFSTQV